jgi:hypothetical protein
MQRRVGGRRESSASWRRRPDAARLLNTEALTSFGGVNCSRRVDLALPRSEHQMDTAPCVPPRYAQGPLPDPPVGPDVRRRRMSCSSSTLTATTWLPLSPPASVCPPGLLPSCCPDLRGASFRGCCARRCQGTTRHLSLIDASSSCSRFQLDPYTSHRPASSARARSPARQASQWLRLHYP